MIICPECGTENPPDSERCLNCNALLTERALEEHIEEQPDHEESLDLLSQADHDLPDLLHALKQDGELPGVEGEQEDLSSEDVVASFSLSELEEIQPDEEMEEPGESPVVEPDQMPEWLQRIRQRAKEETDSIGEITQKIQAAQESLVEDKSAQRHEDYSSFLENLGETFPTNDLEAVPIKEVVKDKDHALEEDQEPDWLERIRKAEGKLGEDEDAANAGNRDGDSLLQWLVALEDGTLKPPTADVEQIEESLQLEDSTQELPGYEDSSFGQAATQEIHVVEPGLQAPPLLEVSKEEQSQADQLSATIADETAVRPIHRRRRAKAPWALRLILGVILITVLSFGLFTGAPVKSNLTTLKPHQQGLLSWAEALSPDASVLVIFDYQAGFADEITLIAQPVLDLIIKPGCEIAILTSSPSGMLLADRLLNEVIGTEDIILRDLGFVPSASLIAYSLASPVTSKIFPLELEAGDFDGVLILSDTFEDAVVWIEQFSARIPSTPVNCLVTAQAGPLLAPYWESGQVTGMISGLSEAHQLEAVMGESTLVAYRWRAYRFGIFMMIAMLVIGATIADEGKREDEGWGGA